MDTRHYRARFEANAKRELPAVMAPALTDEVRAAVAMSLARFQAGETGEGRIAHEIDRVRIATVDDDYRAALKLFVREEGRHARILGDMVRALGGKTLGATKSQSMFTSARRVMGVRTKLLFLLAAEVVGIGFYGVVARALPASPLRDGLDQIMGDEELHLAFHADFFRAETTSPAERQLFRTAFWSVASVACAMVIAIEGRTLDVLGVPRAELGRRYVELVLRVQAAVTDPVASLPAHAQHAPAKPAASRPSVRVVQELGAA